MVLSGVLVGLLTSLTVANAAGVVGGVKNARDGASLADTSANPACSLNNLVSEIQGDWGAASPYCSKYSGNVLVIKLVSHTRTRTRVHTSTVYTTTTVDSGRKKLKARDDDFQVTATPAPYPQPPKLARRDDAAQDGAAADPLLGHCPGSLVSKACDVVTIATNWRTKTVHSTTTTTSTITETATPTFRISVEYSTPKKRRSLENTLGDAPKSYLAQGPSGVPEIIIITTNVADATKFRLSETSGFEDTLEFISTTDPDPEWDGKWVYSHAIPVDVYHYIFFSPVELAEPEYLMKWELDATSNILNQISVLPASDNPISACEIPFFEELEGLIILFLSSTSSGELDEFCDPVVLRAEFD